jgi:hypothetical protein
MLSLRNRPSNQHLRLQQRSWSAKMILDGYTTTGLKKPTAMTASTGQAASEYVQ